MKTNCAELKPSMLQKLAYIRLESSCKLILWIFRNNGDQFELYNQYKLFVEKYFLKKAHLK